MRIKELIDVSSMKWNEAKVRNLFLSRDAELILGIPLSLRLPEDKVLCAATGNGLYSLKSGYWHGKRRGVMVNHECWSKIWDAKITPKVKNFLWRACNDIIPTKSKLVSRHIGNDSSCPMCNQSVETLHHMIFACLSVAQLWYTLNPALFSPNENFSFANIILSWAKMHLNTMFLLEICLL